MEGRLLVDGSKDGRLLGLGGVKSGSEVQLQSLGNLVLQLDLGSEEVGGGPSLYLLALFSKSCENTRRTWVKVKPFLKSTYFPSMSPAMAAELASRIPATLKMTLEGVAVLTSRAIPLDG